MVTYNEYGEKIEDMPVTGESNGYYYEEPTYLPKKKKSKFVKGGKSLIAGIGSMLSNMGKGVDEKVMVEGIAVKRRRMSAGEKQVKQYIRKKSQQLAQRPSSLMGSQTNWQRTRRGGLGLISTATGQRLPGVYNPYARSKGKRGRPRGPSGKYVIPGKGAVSVYVYRKWKAKQNKLRRLNQLQRTYQEQFADGYSEPQYRSRSQPRPVEGYQRDYYEEEPQYTQPRRTFAGGPTGEPVRDYQNILAPQPNILKAPNIFKGELTNVGERGMDVRERPINSPVVNPTGDEFLDVDPLTGQHILRKRPNEKWLSGKPRRDYI